MTPRYASGILLGAAFVGLHACAEPDETALSDLSGASPYAISGGPTRQWKLPASLREISGLATTEEGRLFAIQDEQANVYQLDYAAGSIVKRFALGGPPVKGDFEGIATAPDDAFYMITSAGRLYRFREGGDNDTVRYDAFDTGVRDRCEVEGLAHVASRGALALACKRVYDGRKRFARIYFWSLETQRLLPDPLDVDVRGVRSMTGDKRLSPSGIEWDPRTDHLVMIAAQERVVVEFDMAGKLLWAEPLKRRYHRQAEGITYDPRGNLLISDEGGKGRARLTVYDRHLVE